MKHGLKILSCAMALAVAVPVAASFAGCSKGDKNTFTMWLSPNSDMFQNLDQDLTKNPVIQYVQNKFDIKFEFQVPAKNSEAEQFTVLTGSGDFPDIMDLTYYSGAAIDLVKDGVAVDLTDYIYPSSGDSYFPNYASVLDKDLSLKNTIRTLDNKYYSLATIDDEQRSPWGGYMYRRDLIFKYATAADAEGEANPANWTSKEDVKFPSGAEAPDLISDYDWMLKILKRAKDAGDINYCMSLYYPGYLENGEIISAWGVSGFWYKELENGKTKISFGANSDGFKSYLTKMNEWYKAGYIDTNFTSNTRDQFFAIDPTSYATGKVGCFYGLDTYLGDLLLDDNGVVDRNIDLRACYMPRLTKDSEPISYYVDGRVNRNIMITTKVLDKNYDKLFEALDYLYSEEGALMCRIGLNKAQYAELKEAGITNFWDPTIQLTAEEQQIAGVTSASQKLSDIGVYKPASNGKYGYWSGFEAKPDYELCASAMNFWGLCAVSKFEYLTMSEARYDARYKVWNKYSNSGYIDRTIPTKLSSDDNYDYVVNYNALVDYMAQEVPKFIKGTTSIESGWSNFCKNLVLRGCNKNTGYLQSVFTTMEG